MEWAGPLLALRQCPDRCPFAAPGTFRPGVLRRVPPPPPLPKVCAAVCGTYSRSMRRTYSRSMRRTYSRSMCRTLAGPPRAADRGVSRDLPGTQETRGQVVWRWRCGSGVVVREGATKAGYLLDNCTIIRMGLGRGSVFFTPQAGDSMAETRLEL